MAVEIKAPQFPESVADGTLATWHKQPGDAVSRDELLVDIETDKVVIEVVSPSDGVLEKVLKNEGDTIVSLELLAYVNEEGTASSPASPGGEGAQSQSGDSGGVSGSAESGGAGEQLSPAVRKLIAEKGLDPSQIKGTGRGNRITKEDVEHYLSQGGSAASNQPVSAPVVENKQAQVAQPEASAVKVAQGGREEKRVPMTRLRARVAERLMQAKNNTAMLTTFNEVNMAPIMAMRKQYKEAFVKTHQVKLGFMSFFVRAAVEALKRFPAVNASIDGNDIVYHGFYDVGVAVSSDRGLVVPILRDADSNSLAETEQQIIEYGSKAKAGKLSIEEMTGGTFTISNGGVFGSLISTPILNPPQTAILGMHKIQERPMAVNGEVKILPMMYLALSYDHRLIDGKEAVQFLVTIKDFIEDPAKLLLEL